jgi:hypothetical protein
MLNRDLRLAYEIMRDREREAAKYRLTRQIQREKASWFQLFGWTSSLKAFLSGHPAAPPAVSIVHPAPDPEKRVYINNTNGCAPKQ